MLGTGFARQIIAPTEAGPITSTPNHRGAPGRLGCALRVDPAADRARAARPAHREARARRRRRRSPGSLRRDALLDRRPRARALALTSRRGFLFWSQLIDSPPYRSSLDSRRCALYAALAMAAGRQSASRPRLRQLRSTRATRSFRPGPAGSPRSPTSTWLPGSLGSRLDPLRRRIHRLRLPLARRDGAGRAARGLPARTLADLQTGAILCGRRRSCWRRRPSRFPAYGVPLPVSPELRRARPALARAEASLKPDHREQRRCCRPSSDAIRRPASTSKSRSTTPARPVVMLIMPSFPGAMQTPFACQYAE